MNDSTPVLHAQTLVKAYEEGNNELEVLKGVDLTVHKGDILAIIGASGSGKSTLLNLLGGLDHATRGSVSIAGTSVASLNDRETGRLRHRYLGFVSVSYTPLTLPTIVRAVCSVLIEPIHITRLVI